MGGYIAHMTALPTQTVDQARFGTTRALELPPAVQLGLEFQRRGRQAPPQIEALVGEYRRRGIIGDGEVESQTAIRLGQQRLQQIETRNEHEGSEQGRERFIRENMDRWMAHQGQIYANGSEGEAYWRQQPWQVRLSQPRTLENLPYQARDSFSKLIGPQIQTQRERLGKQYDDLHTPAAEFQRQRDTAAAYLLENFRHHNPDATDQDAYDYMHDELARQGYQLPGVEQPQNAIIDQVALGEKLDAIAKANRSGPAKAVWAARDAFPVAGDAIAGGAGNLLRSAETIAGVSFFVETALGMDSGKGSGSESISRWIDEAIDFWGVDRGNPNDVNGARRFAYDLGGAASDIALIIATRNPAAASRMAAILPGSLYFAGREAASMSRQAYDRYVEQGLDPRSAQLMAGSLGVASGTMTAVLERIPLNEYFDPAKRTLLNRAVRGAIAEGTTEAAQELSSAVLAVGADVEDATLQEALARVLYAGAVGAVAGGASNALLRDQQRIDTLENAARGDQRSKLMLAIDDAYRGLSQRMTGLFVDQDQAVGADAPAGSTQTTETSVDAQGRVTGRSDPKVLATPKHAASWYAKTYNDPAGAEAIAAGMETAGERFELVDIPVGNLQTLALAEGAIDRAKVQSISQLTEQEAADLPPVIATTDAGGGLSVLDGTHRTEGLRQRDPAAIVRAYVPQSIAMQIREGTFNPDQGQAVPEGDQPAGQEPGPGIDQGGAATEAGGAAGTTDTRLTELQTELEQVQGSIDTETDPALRKIYEAEAARLRTAIEQAGGPTRQQTEQTDAEDQGLSGVRGEDAGPATAGTDTDTDAGGTLSGLAGSGTADAIASAKARGRAPRAGEPLGTGRQTVNIDELTPSFIEGTKITPERVDYWRKAPHRKLVPLQVIEEADGTLMVRDGNHRLIASAIEGDTDVLIHIQRSDAQPYTGPERREVDRTTIERPEGDDRASQIRRNLIDAQDDAGKPLTQESRQALLKELQDLDDAQQGRTQRAPTVRPDIEPSGPVPVLVTPSISLTHRIGGELSKARKALLRTIEKRIPEMKDVRLFIGHPEGVGLKQLHYVPTAKRIKQLIAQQRREAKNRAVDVYVAVRPDRPSTEYSVYITTPEEPTDARDTQQAEDEAREKDQPSEAATEQAEGQADQDESGPQVLGDPGPAGSPAAFVTPAMPGGFNNAGQVEPEPDATAPEVPMPAGWAKESAQDPATGQRGKAQRRTFQDTKRGIKASIKQARQRAGKDRASVDAADNIYSIIDDLSRRLGAGRPGRGRNRALGRSAMGFLRPDVEAIRLHKGSYLSTQVHELGHLLHKLLFAPRGKKVTIGSKQLNHLPKEIGPELIALGKALYGSRKPVAGYKSEGWAEAIRMLVTEPKTLRQQAPKTYQLVTMKLKTEYPETWYALLDARVRLRNAIRLAEIDPVDQFVAHDDDKFLGILPAFNKQSVVDWLTARLFERNTRIGTMLQDIDVKLPPNRDPHVLALRINGHISGDMELVMEHGTFNPRDPARKKTGPSLKEIIDPVYNNIRAWQNYMVARRTLEKRAQGYNVLPQDPRMPAMTSNAKLRQDIADKEAEFPEFKTAADQFQAFNKWLIEDYAVAYGLISSDVAKLITDRNLEYITFRYKETNDSLARRFKGAVAGFVNTGTGIKRFKEGHGDQIMPPIDSFMASMQGIISRARLNEVGNAVANLYEGGTPGAGRWLNKIDRPMDASVISAENLRGEVGKQLGIEVKDGDVVLPSYLEGLTDDQLIELVASVEAMTSATFWSPGNRVNRDNQEVSVLTDGTPQFYEVKDKMLFDVLEGMGSPATVNLLVRLLGIPSRVLRAGATQRNPSFAVMNFARDINQALTMSETDLRQLDKQARLRIEGMRQAFFDGDLNQLFLASGADMSGIFGEYYNPITKKLDFDRMFQKKRFKVLKGNTPLRVVSDFLTLGPIARMNENMERAVRLGEFAVTLEQQREAGKSEEEAIAAAGQAAADITLDFQRGGTWSKQINEVVVFFNAAMLGANKLQRFIKQNPGKAAGRIMAFTILPSIISMLLNYDNEDYWAKPQGMRDRYWYIPYGYTDNGKPMYLRLPKPYGLGAFSIATERAFASQFGIDPETGKRGDSRAFDGMTRAMIQEFRPAINLAGLLPIVEVNAGDQGYSFWRDNVIVSDADKDLPYGLQGATRSSELARVLGDQFDYPPAKIDYLIQGFFGGVGQDITGTVVDPVIRAIDPSASQGEPLEFSDWLVVRRFLAGETRSRHEAVTRFFNDYEELQRVQRGLKAYEDQPERYDRYAAEHAVALDLWPMYQDARGRISESFSELRSMYRRRGEIPADEFEAQVDELYDRIISEAQQTKIIRNQMEGRE